jgi:hypothetical protein
MEINTTRKLWKFALEMQITSIAQQTGSVDLELCHILLKPFSYP